MINIKNDELRLNILKYINEYRNKPLSERQTTRIIISGKSYPDIRDIPLETDLLAKHFPTYSKEVINDNVIALKELNYIDANCNSKRSTIFRIKEKGYDFLQNNGSEKPIKIEITNTQPLVNALVSHTNISKEFGEKLIEQLKVFTRLQEENNFYKADEIEILKIQLQELKNENSKVNWDLLLGIIGLIQPLLK